jgi:serine/threonine protein kinase
VLKENSAKFYMCEIILALEYLHKNKCIYRELKPENILIDVDGHIRLTDFGLSKLILSKKEEKAYTICGTPEYLAPEIITEKGYDKAVDWWSLGALFYEMLTGASPFKLTHQEKKENKEMANKLDIKFYTKKIKMFSHFSEEAKSLIEGLLTVNPKQRLGSGPKGSQMIKSHSFFKDINWEDVSAKKLTPPFKPEIRQDDSKVDLGNFDRMFTNENVFEPASEKKEKLMDEAGLVSRDHFDHSESFSPKDYNYEGFTYIKRNTFND